MRRLSLFVLLLAAWVLLVWPFVPGKGIAWQDVLAGLVVALLATLVMRPTEPASPDVPCCCPCGLLWIVPYLGVLAWYVLKANLDVAYRVLHPDMPIKPGIVRVKTRLRGPAAITLLANSITLTPGTLTVNASEDGTLYVHWIYVTSTNDDEAAREIISRFEWYIERIFGQVETGMENA
jgi:multicomponent Na+:H+ antiporter subunit E